MHTKSLVTPLFIALGFLSISSPSSALTQAKKPGSAHGKKPAYDYHPKHSAAPPFPADQLDAAAALLNSLDEYDALQSLYQGYTRVEYVAGQPRVIRVYPHHPERPARHVGSFASYGVFEDLWRRGRDNETARLESDRAHHDADDTLPWDGDVCAGRRCGVDYDCHKVICTSCIYFRCN